nr:MAG TPA: hypothetical protein [Caudoviricetes sp.]
MRARAGCVIWGWLFLRSCSVCRLWCRGLVLLWMLWRSVWIGLAGRMVTATAWMVCMLRIGLLRRRVTSTLMH